MDDALRVRRIKRLRDFRADADDRVEGKGSAAQTLGERLTLEQLHDEEIDLLVRADVVQRADVGMVQQGYGARFRDQPIPRVRILGDAGGDDLDGHRSVETRIAGAIHLPHAALAKRCQDLVRSEARSSQDRHRNAPIIATRLTAAMPGPRR